VEKKSELLEKAVANAFGQIEEKGYARPYEGTGKEIFKVAFAVCGRSDVRVVARH
jgi:hypothetical protein